jgi:cytidylate kinase
MLAERLRFHYLDTGALYRAIALGLVRRGLAQDAPDEEIALALDGMTVEFRGEGIYLGGEDVTREIRTPAAGHAASVFSAREPVRAYLLPVQRRAAEGCDLVAEGRDMGTVVFPRAWRKIYLDATVEARARRRFEQFGEKGERVTMEQARKDVTVRDRRDSTRDLAPLRRADDAFYVDSSALSIDEVLGMMEGFVRGGRG